MDYRHSARAGCIHTMGRSNTEKVNVWLNKMQIKTCRKVIKRIDFL